MNIQKKLTRLGIDKKEEINKKDINYLAHYITNVLTNTFPFLQEQYNEILAKMLNCKMYYAKISSKIAKVNYIYEDDSIYIDESVNIFEPNEQLFHEVIHYLQIERKNNTKIRKMGLCQFGDFSITGLGLNEAIVQYMSAKIMNNEKENLKIYGIRLKTISPNFYPLLTNLIEQLVYLIGEDIIIESDVNVNDNFEDVFFNTFEEKGRQIIKGFDNLLEIKNKLHEELNQAKKKELEQKACNIYKNTEEIMFIKYYNQTIPRLVSIEEIDYYSEKLLKNKEYLGIEEFNTGNFYDEYKTIFINKLDKQFMKISTKNKKDALILYNHKIKEFLKRTIAYFKN